MLKVEHERWGQCVSDLFALSVRAEHARTRERFAALHAIAAGDGNADQWARRTGRRPNTVRGWVRRYNAEGPDAMVYQHFGGRAPFFSKPIAKGVERAVTEDAPKNRGLSGGTWSSRKVVAFLQNTFVVHASRRAVQRLLRRLGLTFRRVKKILAKADPQARADYMTLFHELWRAMQRGEKILIYVDEAHFHRDLEQGWTWGRRGERTWGHSWGAKLSDRINWYGAYDFERGQCLIADLGKNTGEHTSEFLERIHAWLGPERAKRAVIIWDNAPVHKAKVVQAKAKELGLTLQPLPGYSPDLNPIEGLWKWMREEVQHNQFHTTLDDMSEACHAFIKRINQSPDAVLNRLWPRFELNPEEERQRSPTTPRSRSHDQPNADPPPRRPCRPPKSREPIQNPLLDAAA